MKYSSALFTSASGSLRGITATHGRAGAVFRARVKPKDPSTPPQSLRRGALSNLAARWNNVLTEAQRAGWRDYAVSLWPQKFKGFTIFTKVNLIAKVVFPTGNRDNAPAIHTALNIPSAGITIISAASKDVTFQFVAEPAWFTATARLLVYISRPKNPWGRRAPSTRFIGAISGSAGNGTPQLFAGAYPFHCAVGQAVWCEFVALGTSTDSRVSNRYFGQAVAVTA